VKCETLQGKRTFQLFEQQMKLKPDYSELLTLKFWMNTSVDKVSE